VADSPPVVKCLEAAKTSTKEKGDGKPINFGVVIPGTIYRSSFPEVNDFQYLGTLGLKTIL
jgi:tyrosine-protein phosphatase SIW14